MVSTVPAPGEIGGANGYAGMNGLVNNAMAMKNTMVSYALLFVLWIIYSMFASLPDLFFTFHC